MKRLSDKLRGVQQIYTKFSQFDKKYSESIEQYIEALVKIRELTQIYIDSRNELIGLCELLITLKGNFPLSDDELGQRARWLALLEVSDARRDPKDHRDLLTRVQTSLAFASAHAGDNVNNILDVHDEFGEILSVKAYNTWRTAAPVIGDALRFALEAANPKKTIGLSTGGPVCRFVTAVIPLIFGERPTEDNVGKCLKIAGKATPDNRDLEVSGVREGDPGRS